MAHLLMCRGWGAEFHRNHVAKVLNFKRTRCLEINAHRKCGRWGRVLGALGPVSTPAPPGPSRRRRVETVSGWDRGGSSVRSGSRATRRRAGRESAVSEAVRSPAGTHRAWCAPAHRDRSSGGAGPSCVSHSVALEKSLEPYAKGQV